VCVQSKLQCINNSQRVSSLFVTYELEMDVFKEVLMCVCEVRGN
jgi:hypothetical protein